MVLLLAGVILGIAPSAANAAIPPQIEYQGYLTDGGGKPINGNRQVTFSMWDTAVGGVAALWSEVQTVSLSNGIYNVKLPNDPVGNPFPSDLFDGDLYLGIKVASDAEMVPRQKIVAVPFAMKAEQADFAILAQSAQYGVFDEDLYIGGQLGIGTDSPRTDLEIKGIDGIRVSTGQHSNVYGEFRHGYSDGLIINANAGGGWADMRFQTDGNTRMFIESGGNVGIGTTTPTNKLDIAGSVSITGRLGIGTTAPGTKLEINGNGSSWADGFLTIKNDNQDAGIRISDGADSVKHHIFNDNALFDVLRIIPAGAYTNGGITIFQGGNVGIGTGVYVPTSRLAVKGNIAVVSATSNALVAEIGEGLDYAEGFDVSVHPVENIEPGAVLVIDPDDPGKLRLSTEPYDSKVAGIVAGAKGLGSGVRLGAGQFDYDVALAGRVYCMVDAGETDVRPGDLLTTSATPGHAMKVTDAMRGQGAILGKAMDKLEKGRKGQILVLVTLQ
jgi:hypothetical protein